MRSWFIGLFFVLLALTAGASAQDTEEEDENIPEEPVFHLPPKEVSTVAIFPRAPEGGKSLYIGEVAEVIIGVQNGGDVAYTISHAAASIRHTLDFRYSIQNFTREDYFVTIEPEEEISLSYFFVPSEHLDPREWGLTVAIAFFDVEGRNFTTLVYNGTIDFIEPESTFDLQTFFTYVFALAVGGLIVFAVMRFTANLSEKSQKRRRLETGTVKKVELGDEWLVGTSADPSKKTKGQKSSKRQ